MKKLAHLVLLLLAPALTDAADSWPRSDGGTIKLINPKTITLKNGCYVNEKLVDVKARTFMERSEWVSYFFPLPTDFEVTKVKSGYRFGSDASVSMTPVHFLFNFELNEKDGTYEGFTCVKDSKWGGVNATKGCITHIRLENETVFTIHYGDIETKFINITGFKSQKPQATEFGPCEWP